MSSTNPPETNLPTRPTRLWQTAIFRLAIVYALIFGAGGAALLVALDFGIARVAEQELEDSLRSQMAIMRADANLEGGMALVGVLRGHHESGDPSPYNYFVLTPDGTRFNAGLPDTIPTEEGLHRISVPSANARPGVGNEIMDLMILVERARDGTLMGVARNTSQLDELGAGLHRVALVGGIGLTVLAVVGGLALGSMVLKRLQRVNAAADRIMGGDSTKRLPSVGFGREFDALVSSLNQMLDRLDHAMVTLRRFSSDLAHDLRTPLTRLRNTLEETPPTLKPAERAWAERGIAEIDDALDVLSSLLRIAQIEGADSRAAFALVDLNTIAESVIDAYSPAAEEGGHHLVDRREPAAMVLGDAALLKQLLANLVDNAIRHTPPGTTVRVEIASDGPNVTLAIADNGPGVPAAELGNLTKRLYRLDRSRTTPGSGLGLTLAKAIAELHGTTLTLSDNTPGLRAAITLKCG